MQNHQYISASYTPPFTAHTKEGKKHSHIKSFLTHNKSIHFLQKGSHFQLTICMYTSQIRKRKRNPEMSYDQQKATHLLQSNH